MLALPNSARLYLRPASLADAREFLQLDQDPEVMHYVGGVSTGSDLTATTARLAKLISGYARQSGLGLWACCLRADDQFIGWFMLKACTISFLAEDGACLEPTEHIELGYRLARRFWGHGYATEMARQVVAHGLEQLALDEILAVTIPENQASVRVLEKAGLGYRGRGTYHGTNVVIYTVTNARSIDP